ncbi:Biorientation of chromosomes in cell division protein 1 [Fukomys damarensis]|uniref:Biorientation of chromosomes in cell division protein 1 n=1 Tax=Fukomys damarensis TaxID=885580 RepID=A0A091D9W6_FUKDA|nr:Biorientation of chromosomes in cell division protein 1 [Fukomys damarensis]
MVNSSRGRGTGVVGGGGASQASVGTVAGGTGGSGGSGPINLALAPASNPQSITVIMEQLKSQSLFDSFHQDYLADLDTKPTYQNVRPQVDNFVLTNLEKQE